MSSDSAGSEVRAAMDALRRIVRALRLVAKSAETELGVTTSQLFVLQVVKEGGRVSINDIAERTYTDQSSVSVIVTRLVRAGLVNRVRSAEDGRRVNVSLTSAGKSLLSGAPPTVQTKLIEALGALPAGRRKVLSAELTGLATVVESTRSTAGMFFDDQPQPPPKRTAAQRPSWVG